jgi:hypothetical protein
MFFSMGRFTDFKEQLKATINNSTTPISSSIKTAGYTHNFFLKKELYRNFLVFPINIKVLLGFQLRLIPF